MLQVNEATVAYDHQHNTHILDPEVKEERMVKIPGSHGVDGYTEEVDLEPSVGQ